MNSARSVALLACLAGCASSGSANRSLFDYKAAASGPATAAPEWVTSVKIDPSRLCGVGVAGAGYNADSPYPKKLSEDRAVLNLAGILGTNVQEAIIDRSTNRGQAIRTARALTVDEALVEQVRQLAETDFWYDKDGTGPFAAKSFTYAQSCIDAKVAADKFHVDAKAVAGNSDTSLVNPQLVPKWLSWRGTQPGGRLCAIGFSSPMFHADKTFVGVVEDIRGQLSRVLQTLVSSYYEELTTTRGAAYEAMTVATTDAISKGAIVTHYWYDRDGRGPIKQKRSTYGWGCIYPVEVLEQSVAAAEASAPPEEKNVIAQVKERAQHAFEDLDAEIAKREGAPPPDAPASEPAAPVVAQETTAPATE
jgi:hypothetical protein